MAQPQNSLVADFVRRNPHLGSTALGEGSAEGPYQGPESVAFGPGCRDAERTVSAGGFLPDLLMHPSVVPFQWTFRKLPNIGVFIATRSQPYQFEIGAFTVPENMSLVVAQYRFQPFRFSGAEAAEPVPLEDQLQSLSIAYDILIANTHKGNIRTELIPAIPSVLPASYLGNPTGGTITNAVAVTSSVFGTIYEPSPVQPGANNPQPGAPGLTYFPMNAQQYLNNLSGGDGLLPQSQADSQGPSKFPFSYYAEATQAVSLRVNIFKGVTVPIAFFQATLAGYLMTSNALKAMLAGIKPCT